MVVPQPADLASWGAHDVYALNGAFQSVPGKVFISRTVPAVASAYDPVQNKLYVLSRGPTSGGTTDLTVFDPATGNVLNSLPGIPFYLHTAALSADGNYLYMAGANAQSLAQLVRYNTATNAIDLQWQIAPVNGVAATDINAIVTPPDSPQTVIASTASGQVLIFDGNQPRAYDSISAGFSTNYFNGGYPIFFASSTRIYVISNATSTGSTCWVWLDYDAFGISGGQPSCSGEPPETQHDHGVTYLTDGTRISVISLPPPLPSSSQIAAADLTRRQAWQLLSVQFGTSQLFGYNMDAEQFQLLAPITLYSNTAAVIYPTGNGLLLVFQNSIMLVP
jgi:hypothetical protein